MRERYWQRAGRRDLRRSLSWPYEREEQMRAITKSFIIAAIATTAMGANAQEAKQTERGASNEMRKQQQQSAVPTGTNPTNVPRKVVHDMPRFDVVSICTSYFEKHQETSEYRMNKRKATQEVISRGMDWGYVL